MARPGAHRVRAADGAEREVALHRGEVVTLAPRPPDDGPGVGPLVLGAAGVVALGVGVGLTLDASGRRDDLRDDLAGDGPCAASRAPTR
ncbi:MAG: hypothetical protein H6745_07325 [Deltaproteobacteria bacterium]|nr:hypothetical protein [Deltaproteobacteria bacterium]